MGGQAGLKKRRGEVLECFMTKLQRERAGELPVCCAEALERNCPDDHGGTHRCEYCGGMLAFLDGEWRPASLAQEAPTNRGV